jgi:hypothetical protein
MKPVRYIALVMLAFLYLGGTYAQISGAAFPLVGTGKKAYGNFNGREKEPSRPTISPRRHMPMVKPVELSPLVSADKPEVGRSEEFQTTKESRVCPSLLTSPALACGSRAPPHS